MEQISTKFDHLFRVISSDSFLRKEALGGEIPFFISAYKASDQKEIHNAIQLLKRRLENHGVPVLELNLYNIAIKILEETGGIERILRAEKSRSKEKFLRALQSTLNIHQVFMPKMKELILDSQAKVYFLTGIGQVYPYIRSHIILNNLQSIAKDAPTIAFFPGVYDGLSLKLFGLLKDDNYYRAFNIENIEA